jgi:hypothetical protein
MIIKGSKETSKNFVIPEINSLKSSEPFLNALTKLGNNTFEIICDIFIKIMLAVRAAP